MDSDVAGGVDAQPYLIAAHVDNDDFHIVADHDRLILLSAQNQHPITPFCLSVGFVSQFTKTVPQNPLYVILYVCSLKTGGLFRNFR